MNKEIKEFLERHILPAAVIVLAVWGLLMIVSALFLLV
jgi:hypothetical protein